MSSTQKPKLSNTILKQLGSLPIRTNFADFSDLSEPIPGNIENQQPLNSRSQETRNLYAIAFDLDTSTLQKAYHVAAYNNAYADIRNRLVTNHGFAWQQGSVYFGGDSVNAVTCVVAVIDLTNTFPWFAASVRDIRMLRIEEQNDLSPAIRQALLSQNPEPKP